MYTEIVILESFTNKIFGMSTRIIVIARIIMQAAHEFATIGECQ